MANFDNAGQNEGIEHWRIENFQAVRQDGKDGGQPIGHFNSGDSYLVLHSHKLKGRNALAQDLYFWLGKDSSQDERGACAYKAVELDDSLGGRPVQHREVQDHESASFMALFKGGVTYHDGGVESGFRKVVRDEFELRLLQCKGRRNVRVRRVEVERESLNEGDVFILDAGLAIYTWHGKDCNRKEKAKALDVAQQIRNDERGGRAKVHIIGQCDASFEEEFWQLLGGAGDVASAEAGGADEQEEEAMSKSTVLFQINDDNGISFEEVARGALDRNMLDSTDAFVIDTPGELFVWVGRGASKEEKKESMIIAAKYLADSQDHPDWTPVTRCIEGGETALFKSHFVSWAPPALPKAAAAAGADADFSSQQHEAVEEAVEVDVKAMHAKRDAEDEKMVDDGSGKLQIWRIEDFKPVEVPESQHGRFYEGDSYVVQYDYLVGGRENCLLYFYLGATSSTDEKGAAALIAREMDDALGGKPVQVRVVMHKEPAHFLRLFKGRMVVEQGGHASGFKNAHDDDSYDTDGVSLFHIKGTTDLNVRAVQVEEKAVCLNSGDCFVLTVPDAVYVWQGLGANSEEKMHARNTAEILSSDRVVSQVDEGEEPEMFWDSLGGKDEYPTSIPDDGVERAPRMFEASNASGTFKIEEIFNFAQPDLDPADVYILDTFTEVFLWLGPDATESERKNVLTTGMDYVAHAEDGRDADAPVLVVRPGSEPPQFTAHFAGWSYEVAQQLETPLARAEREIAEANGIKTVERMSTAKDLAAVYAGDRVVSLADLRKRPFPVGIDPTKSETYLSPEDFLDAFKMDLPAFQKLPLWKRDMLRKNAGVF